MVAAPIVFTVLAAFAQFQLAAAYPSMMQRRSVDFSQPVVTDSLTPCPAMNTLVRAGKYGIPADGQGVPKDVLINAMTQTFFVGSDVGEFFWEGASLLNLTNSDNTIDLINIRRHNAIEHDASLSRTDLYFAPDSFWLVNKTLVDDFLSRADSNNQLSLDAFAATRAARAKYSEANNADVTFGVKQHFIAFGEASLLWNMFAVNGLVDADLVREFLYYERIPEGWVSPNANNLVGLARVTETLATLQFKALFD